MSRVQFQIPKPPQLSTIQRYGSVPPLTALMVVLQYVVLPDPHIAPFMFFFLGVSICAWLAGRWPGVLMATLSAVTSNYLFVAPHRGWALSTSALTVTIVFLLAASATAMLCGSLRDAMLIAEQAAIELRAGQKLLREADDHKTHFMSVLSHELRNPLSPIVNALFILDQVPSGEQAAQARAIIARQVQHLTRIIDDLLDVTRISRGKVVIQHMCVNLVEIVKRTLQDYGALFTDRNCQLESSLPSQPIWVVGDPTRLAQVFSNLLTNSAKFARGACTWITVEQRGDEAIIRVRDNGVGMHAELLAHVFEPFVQADRTLAHSAGGLGLGLALVKGLVELHGGRVSAFSDGEGMGSEFTVALPAVPAPPSTADVQSMPRGTTTSPRRILVIEDNVDVAVSLQAALELAGHKVALEYDGPAGLATARAWRPEIVLCDIGLPSMDGYRVAQQLRADRERPFLVALTGYALPEDQEKARQAGFDAHLAKPPSLDELARLIAEGKPSSASA